MRGGLVYVLFFAALGALSHTPAQYFDNLFGLRLIALRLHLVEQGLYDVSICPFHGPMMPQNPGREAASNRFVRRCNGHRGPTDGPSISCKNAARVQGGFFISSATFGDF